MEEIIIINRLEKPAGDHSIQCDSLGELSFYHSNLLNESTHLCFSFHLKHAGSLPDDLSGGKMKEMNEIREVTLEKRRRTRHKKENNN